MVRDNPNLLRQVRLTRGQRFRRWLGRSAWKATHKSARHGWKKRRTLAPSYVGFAVILLGELAHVLPTGWLTAAWLGLPAAAICWWWVGGTAWKLTRKKRARKTHRGWWLAGIGVAWALFLLVALLSWAPPMPFPVIVATTTFQVRWLWHRRVRPTAAKKNDPDVATWKAIDGFAKTSIEFTDLPADRGRSALADLSDSNLTADDVVAKLKAITKAYRKTAGAVVVERTPEEYEHLVKVMILKRNPTQEITEYDESWVQLEDGCTPFSTYPDAARAWLRIWEPRSGCVHELFSGDPRTGKSRGMVTAMTQSVMTGLVFPIVGDPQQGQSMPGWAGADGKAPITALDVESIHDVLRALRTAMYRRSNYLSKRLWTDEDNDTHRGMDFFDPTVVPELPILEMTIDEAHRLLEFDHIADLVEEIALMAGKTGIRLRLATQYPSMDNLGNRMTIRNSLIGGNTIAYRISTAVAQGMILPAWLPGPHTIPKRLPSGEHTKGMLVLDSSAPNSSRGTFSRTVWTRREHHWAGIAAKRIPKLHDLDMEVFGSDFSAWRQKTQLAVAAQPSQTGSENGVQDPSAPLDDRIAAYLATVDTGRTGVIADHVGKDMATVSKTLARMEGKRRVDLIERGVWALVRSESDEQNHATETAGAA
jgi:hypothetical protein